MSKNIEFKLNKAGLTELLKSGAMKNVLNSAASQGAAAAGAGYTPISAYNLSFTAISRVKASTWAAKLDNSKNDTMLKAVGGVRV